MRIIKHVSRISGKHNKRAWNQYQLRISQTNLKITGFKIQNVRKYYKYSSYYWKFIIWFAYIFHPLNKF